MSMRSKFSIQNAIKNIVSFVNFNQNMTDKITNEDVKIIFTKENDEVSCSVKKIDRSNGGYELKNLPKFEDHIGYGQDEENAYLDLIFMSK